MQVYVCSSCKREVVVRSTSKNLSLKCCKGENPVSFSVQEKKAIISVPELPKAMTENKSPAVLPKSTISPIPVVPPAGITPAK